MKILKYIIGVFLLASLLVACEEDDYEPKSSFSDAGYYSSYGATQQKVAGVGDWESFMDMSQGAIYHTWSIESGNYFLGGPLELKQKELEKFVVNKGDTVSDETTINVWFQKGDTASVVRLFNVFEDSVSFRTVDSEGENTNIAAVYQEDGEWAGKWVFDYEILVDVYDTIVTDMVMRKDGNVIDHTVEGEKVTVMVGEQIEFEDLSAEVDNTARPDATTWRLQTIAENPDDVETIGTSGLSTVSYTFKKMGVFNMVLVSRRTGGENIPGDTEEYKIPVVFEVVQSDQPFIQEGVIRELEDETIQVPFNAEFNSTFTDPKDHFTVKVNGVEFDVAKVTLHQDKSSVLQLKLVEAIYASDVITVSFDGLATDLMSSDERTPSAFTDVPVINFDPNMLDFEAASFEDTFGTIWKASSNNSGVVEYSTEQAFRGNNSLKISTSGETRGRAESSVGNLLVLEAGTTYTVRYKRYVVGGGTIAGDKVFIRFPQVQINNAVASFDAALNDTWEELEFDYTPADDTDGDHFYIQLNPGDGTVYYDDFYIAPKESR